MPHGSIITDNPSVKQNKMLTSDKIAVEPQWSVSRMVPPIRNRREYHLILSNLLPVLSTRIDQKEQQV